MSEQDKTPHDNAQKPATQTPNSPSPSPPTSQPTNSPVSNTTPTYPNSNATHSISPRAALTTPSPTTQPQRSVRDYTPGPPSPQSQLSPTLAHLLDVADKADARARARALEDERDSDSDESYLSVIDGPLTPRTAREFEKAARGEGAEMESNRGNGEEGSGIAGGDGESAGKEVEDEAGVDSEEKEEGELTDNEKDDKGWKRRGAVSEGTGQGVGERKRGSGS